MSTRRPFTDTWLRSLRPKAVRYDVTDVGRRGLQVRVFPSGQKSFQFRYTYAGAVRRLTLGTYPYTSLAEAHDAHAEALKQLRQGKDPAYAVRPIEGLSTPTETVGALADEFMRRYVLIHRKRPEAVQQMLNANVLPHWRNRAAKDITPRDVTLLLDQIVDRGSPTMANRVAAVISQMFKFGVQRGLLAGSPCVAVQRPGGREKPRERKFTEDEIQRFWRQLDTAGMTEPLKLACRLLLVTAQRRGELARARWADIDRPTAVWTIPAEHSKNGKPHSVPLSRLALDLLAELHLQTGYSPYLFPSAKGTNDPIVDRSLTRAVHNNLEHFGLEAFTPHDLRRTEASMMTMLGVPRLHVSKLLNHTEESITAVYDQHDYAAEKRAALDLWAQHLIVVARGGARKVVALPARRRRAVGR